jgi:serine/threonine-protein kinase
MILKKCRSTICHTLLLLLGMVLSCTPAPTPITATHSPSSPAQVRVYVPAGEFEMGAKTDDRDAWDGEPFPHSVYLDAFWIDQTEVTNTHYEQCVQAGHCVPPATCEWGAPTYGDPVKADEPVVCVTWTEAQAYCNWAGGQLPTEAQWEKAARGTDGRIYPWGSVFDGTMANYCDARCEFEWKDGIHSDGYTRLAPVGNYPAGASPYGVLDMAGNAWEWVADWYEKYYYESSPSENPTGPTTGVYRVLRGGAWTSVPRSLRSTTRDFSAPDLRDDGVGFRCVVVGTD